MFIAMTYDKMIGNCLISLKGHGDYNDDMNIVGIYTSLPLFFLVIK